MTQIDTSRWTAAGGIVDEARATLTVQGADLEPDSVTAILGVEPQVSYRKGERISQWREDVRLSGYWAFEVSAKAPSGPDSAVVDLLALLPSDIECWSSLQGYRPHLTVTLIVKQWNRGFRLPSDLVAALAARGLMVDFDIYAEPQPLPSACS